MLSPDLGEIHHEIRHCCSCCFAEKRRTEMVAGFRGFFFFLVIGDCQRRSSSCRCWNRRLPLAARPNFQRRMRKKKRRKKRGPEIADRRFFVVEDGSAAVEHRCRCRGRQSWKKGAEKQPLLPGEDDPVMGPLQVGSGTGPASRSTDPLGWATGRFRSVQGQADRDRRRGPRTWARSGFELQVSRTRHV